MVVHCGLYQFFGMVCNLVSFIITFEAHSHHGILDHVRRIVRVHRLDQCCDLATCKVPTMCNEIKKGGSYRREKMEPYLERKEREPNPMGFDIYGGKLCLQGFLEFWKMRNHQG